MPCWEDGPSNKLGLGHSDATKLGCLPNNRFTPVEQRIKIFYEDAIRWIEGLLRSDLRAHRKNSKES